MPESPSHAHALDKIFERVAEPALFEPTFVTGYQVTPYIGGTAQAPILTGSAATNYTVTGLTNGTTYTFTVAAITAVGTGSDRDFSCRRRPAGCG